MDKPFIVYAGIDKITIGNGSNGKAYDVSVELAAAAPALLEALEAIERRSNCKCEGANDWKCVKCTARAAIAPAKGESYA